MNAVDIDGYPIIRIDQIASLDTSSLKQAQQDATTLLQELRAESQPSPLVSYLCRQIAAMEREVSSRAAVERVQALLDGTCDLLTEHKYESLSLPSPQVPVQKDPVVHKPLQTTVTAPAAPPTPVPTPLIPISAMRNENDNDKPFSTPVPMSTPALSRNSVSSASHDTPVASGRPPSGRARRSIAIYNENFGNAFVVAATEKKKRYYPKKAAVEDPDVAKQKAREARRENAMKRLQERKKKENARRRMLMVRKKRQEEMEKQTGVTTNDSTQSDDVSETESISDADNDATVPSVSEDVVRKLVVNSKQSSSVTSPIDVSNEAETDDVFESERNHEMSSEPPIASESSPLPTEKERAALQKIRDETEINVNKKNQAALAKLRELKALKKHPEAPIVVDEEVKQIFREAHRASMSPRPENDRACNTAFVPPSLNTCIVSEPEQTKPHVDENVQTAIMIHDQRQIDSLQELSTLSTAHVCVETQCDNHSPSANKANVTSEARDSQMTSDCTTTSEKCTTASKIENPTKATIIGIHDVIVNPRVMHVDRLAPCAAVRSVITCEIRDDRRVYVLPVGPDELPGLRAWTLGHVSDDGVAWKVDLTRYANELEEGEATLMRNISARRHHETKNVPVGLVLLAKLCEPLLVGAVAVATEAAFRRLWESYIRHFDTMAVSYSSELFVTVASSANLQAVCKKLENLVKTYFVKSSRSKHRTIDELHVETSPRPKVESNATSESFSRYNDPVFQSAPATPMNTSEADQQDLFMSISSKSRDFSESSDSDDDMILPSILPSKPSPGIAIENKVASPPTPVLRPPSATRNVRLCDYYDTIASIFPLFHDLSIRRVDEVAARSLIESMQFQLKLYEEWMEVMDDYATVFCADSSRGIETTSNSNDKNALVYAGGSRALHYRIKSSRPEVCNIMSDVFNNILCDWVELPQDLGLGMSWNILWSWGKPKINMSHLLIWQKINHFVDSKQLTRKDLLKRNLQRFTDRTGKAGVVFEIMPKTFLLPNEYTLFVREFMSHENEVTESGEKVKNIWIMKPVGLSRGRGITLVKDMSQLAYSHTSVLQRYVPNPLCLDGYKFDLRLYVLVTSFQPLEAFIYQDGFARISTQRFSLDEADLDNKFIHLTNSSIQNQSTSGPSKDNPLVKENEGETNGSKIPLLGKTGLWKRLERYNFNTDVLWKNICLLVVKSLVAVDDKIAHQPCCFEVFGYDVLIDELGRPWLLEVNASPSMGRDTQLDVRVKNSMICDTIRLLDVAPYDRAAVARVLKKRIKDISSKNFALSKSDPDLENNLKDILGDYIPRKYGEVPKNMGGYEMLCPNTKFFESAMKFKGKIIKGAPG